MLDGDDRVIWDRDLEATASEEVALGDLLADAPLVGAAVHRVVHGGPRLREAVVASEEAVQEVADLGEMAPLHNEVALAHVRELGRLRPDLAQLLCFDTAFHASLPAAAAAYAIPNDWSEGLGVRRYGFHGLSHAYASRRAAELLDRPVTELRTVTGHLGAGASLAAVAGGRCVDTTMGFTPNDGLVMATRSGSVDPSAVLWVLERESLSPAAARAALEHESGLLGLSGVSGDIRDVLGAAHGGSERARLAIDVYVHRLRAGVAAMAAAMGGVDAVVFTGGVGQNSAPIRARACEGLEFLGLALDPDANASGSDDRDIATPTAPTRVLVMEAREDLQMAAEARSLLRVLERFPGGPIQEGP